MKTKITLLALIAMVFTNIAAQTAGKHILVVYYSYSGNTRQLAQQIRQSADADIFEIEPVKAYPTDYNTCTEQAKQEINAAYKPELKKTIDNIGQYDVIFVGSPCWWGTIAPPVSSFLSNYDLAGKTIVPFMTHEGSRMGHSESDIQKLCPKSTLLKGLPIRGSNVGKAQNEVQKWLDELKLLKK